LAKRRIRKNLILKMFDMGMTNNDAAYHLDIRASRMSDYRHGYRKKLSPSQVDKLCRVLGCKIEDILYADDIRQYNSDKEREK